MGKDFKNKIGSKRLDTLIPGDSQVKPEMAGNVSSKKEELASTRSSQSTVATFRVNSDKLNQLKAVAYWDRKKIQDVLDEALQTYFDQLSPTSLNKAVEEYERSVS